MKLESKTIENKRLLKHFELASWADGKFEQVKDFDQLPNTHIPYNKGKDDLVYDMESDSVITLPQAMKKHKVESVWGYQGIKDSLSIADKWAVKVDADGATFWKGAQKSSGLIATFAFKLDKDKKCLNPHAAGIYVSKMTTFKAMVETEF